ncbi:G2/mitotic-specific cyclin CLB2-like [Stylophora pistillata]|uniref:G2/mitotic-specific cyclin CLB2-like n=1 Tax=Stylophora pistillata TaxID=50429 RepID=UPI000C04641F|nr:G2/mitotic-specific cyclin CLB2-like [Stylophora pistillata]
MQVNIVPVGVGDYAKLSELKVIATNDGTARRFGEYESPETLGTAVIQVIEGKDIYEKYKDYFTTPYFIFFRDMLSYLTLVGLHFAICLSPSTVSFSRLEWAILVFFLGRIFMEVDQFISAKKAGVKARKMLNKESDEPNNEGSEENETSNDNIWPEKFTRYFRAYIYVTSDPSVFSDGFTMAEEYKLSLQTLYLTINYIDRFLSVMSVLRGKLQLVRTACMLIAAKFEEIYPPDISDFVYITDDTYTAKQVLKMESLILKTLGFEVCSPTILNFLERFLKATECPEADKSKVESLTKVC